MKNYKYITQLAKADIDENNVIDCIDENDFPSIVIKNTDEKSVASVFSTDNLNIKLNTRLELEESEYFVHIISSKRKDAISIEQFVTIYEYIFHKISTPISEVELSKLLIAIEEYFKTTPDIDKTNLQVGVYGELLFIKSIYEKGYNRIINKYHKNFYMKHDVEISPTFRIELKATLSPKRIHRFKHDQICRTDIELYVGSLILELSEAGCSLYELFLEVIRLCDDPDMIFSIKKLMKKCDVSESDKGICVSYEKALENIKIFDAANLPKLDNSIPNGITSIEYDVDCSFSEEINIDDFVSLLLACDS